MNVPALVEGLPVFGVYGRLTWRTEPCGTIILTNTRTEEIVAMFFGLRARTNLALFLATDSDRPD